MVSAARVESNRRNAKLSTGPRTPEGKRRVSQNAREHGYRAGGVAIIPHKQTQELEKIASIFAQTYTPQDAVGHALLQSLSTAWWTLVQFEKLFEPLYATTDYE